MPSRHSSGRAERIGSGRRMETMSLLQNSGGVDLRLQPHEVRQHLFLVTWTRALINCGPDFVAEPSSAMNAEWRITPGRIVHVTYGQKAAS